MLYRLNLLGILCLKIFLEITVKIELDIIAVFILWKRMEVLNYLSFPVLVCITGFAAQ